MKLQRDKKPSKKSKKPSVPKYKVAKTKNAIETFWSTHLLENDFYNEGDTDFVHWKSGKSIPELDVHVGELVFVKTNRNYDIFSSSGHFTTSRVTIYPSAQWSGNSGLWSVTAPNSTTIIGTGIGAGTTTPAGTTVTVPQNITKAGQTVSAGTTGKLGMSMMSNGNNSNQMTPTTVYSSSVVIYKTKPITTHTLPQNTTGLPAEEFVANGFKTIDDLLNHRNAVSIKQEQTWTDEERQKMAVEINNPLWSGRPFVGMVVDRYIPNTKTEKGEAVFSTISNKTLYTAYKILLDEYHCFWFKENDIFPVKSNKKENNK